MGLTGKDEEKWLAARVEDCITQCTDMQYPFYTSFLTPEEQLVAHAVAKRLRFTNYIFFAGYEDGERCMFGAFPGYMEPDASSFPIIPLAFSYPSAYNLSHRDFLGALMGTGIKREAVGDILVGDGRSVVFIKAELADYICTQVDKIGRIGVKIKAGSDGPLPGGKPPEEISCTLASMRLDAIVAAVLHISREKSVKLIASGMVSVNHKVRDSVSMVLKPDDRLVIRGKGKFVIGQSIGLTKKGRVRLVIKQYR